MVITSAGFEPSTDPDFHLPDAVHYRGLTGQIVGIATVEDRVVYDIRTSAGFHRVVGGTDLLVLAEPLEAAPYLARSRVNG